MIEENLGRFQVKVVGSHDLSPEVIQSKQEHGGTIMPVSQAQGAVADGMLAMVGEKPFAIRTADCLPLIICNTRQVVGVHVSRKSLLTDILSQAMRYFADEPPTFVFIGPHICAKHFSFAHQGEQIKQFCDLYPKACQITEGVTSLDIRSVVDDFLTTHIKTPYTLVDKGSCTYEDTSLPSHRRLVDQGGTEKLEHLFTVVRS